MIGEGGAEWAPEDWLLPKTGLYWQLRRQAWNAHGNLEIIHAILVRYSQRAGH
jgi:hypothetical protein